MILTKFIIETLYETHVYTPINIQDKGMFLTDPTSYTCKIYYILKWHGYFWGHHVRLRTERYGWFRIKVPEYKTPVILYYFNC